MVRADSNSQIRQCLGFVQLIFGPPWPQLNKNPTLPNSRLPISSNDGKLDSDRPFSGAAWASWCAYSPCGAGGSSCSSPCRTRTPASRRRRHSPPLGNKAIVSRQTRRYFLFFRSYMLREREPRFKKERDCFSKCVWLLPWSAPGCRTGNGGKISNTWFDGLNWFCLGAA